MALQNPSFEGEYVRHAGTVLVAPGWTPFYASGDPPQEPGQGPCAMPEYKPLPRTLDAHRVVEGDTAQCWFLNWKVMDAGVYQQVDAVPGGWYQFSASCQAWCDKDNDPEVSRGEMYVSLGIDPHGGQDAFAQSVIWSGWDWVGPEHERYESPVVQAQAGTITVYVRSWNKWKLRHNDLYTDAARLERTDEEPTPTPSPGPGAEVDYAHIRQIVQEVVREELDATTWGSK